MGRMERTILYLSLNNLSAKIETFLNGFLLGVKDGISSK